MKIENKITIVTAVKNGEAHIWELIESLNKQKNNNIKWLVVDGGSTDNTLSIIESEIKIEYNIVKTKDFSIYHAFNIALEYVDTTYYIAAGADDKFADNFSELIADFIETEEYDLIIGGVQKGDYIFFPSLNKEWFYGTDAPHSVGTITRCSLHNQFGKYSNLYPIAADRFFLKQVINSGAKYINIQHIFGYYSLDGMSTRLKIDSICDLFRIQMATNESFLVQLLLLTTRLLKTNFS